MTRGRTAIHALFERRAPTIHREPRHGPMFVLEAVGGDRFPPKVPAGPDSTGIQSLHSRGMCPSGGTIRTCGVGFPRGATVTIPAGHWSNSGRTHLPGNFAGVNTFRDRCGHWGR